MKIKKILAILMAVLIFVSACAVSASATSTVEYVGYEEVAYNMEELFDSMRLLGRAVMNGTKLGMAMNGSGFEFKAICEGDITLRLTSSASGYIKIIVDDDYDNAFRVTIDGPGRFVVDTNMAPGLHTIQVVRATEFNKGEFMIRSIAICGEKYGAPPAEKGMKLEFYGDSLTAGYGNIATGSGKGGWQYQDGTLTYAAFCARELDADYSAIAASGHGITTGFSSRSQLISTYWDKTGVTGFDWDFSYDADVVVINLGTNDQSYFTNSKTQCNEEEFKTNARALIDGILSHNSDCKMYWIYGMAYLADNDYHSIVTWLGDLADEYDCLDLLYISTGASGGDGHPTVAQHQAAGKILVDVIRKYYTDNGLEFPENPEDPLPPPSYQIGDCNGDDAINGKDVLALRKYIVNLIGDDEIVLKAADCNGDDAINGKDVLQLRKYIVGLINEF
ncbi:MAG: hypothetical protein II306_08365 [Clostridia bacterium]|nr:hypothetical protein [Clostridia bacterium]MEE1023527.1 GDSL-type esterase/lipase family protein [Acutalibacteraceae bacterium]